MVRNLPVQICRFFEMRMRPSRRRPRSAVLAPSRDRVSSHALGAPLVFALIPPASSGFARRNPAIYKSSLNGGKRLSEKGKRPQSIERGQ